MSRYIRLVDESHSLGGLSPWLILLINFEVGDEIFSEKIVKVTCFRYKSIYFFFIEIGSRGSTHEHR